MRRIVRGLLSEMGCEEIEEAEDGVVALRLLRASRFDFVICDINMPNMNGFELLKEVKLDDALKSIPILMVTAEARKEDIVLAAKGGAAGYTIRPFTKTILKEKGAEDRPAARCDGVSSTMKSETQAFDPSTWVTEDKVAAPSDVYQTINVLMRQLHASLEQLGVMPTLQNATAGLPDARSRLSYIAAKRGESATKVLNSVDLAKADQKLIAEAARGLVTASFTSPDKAVDAATVTKFAVIINAARERSNAHLTDITMAQDYHDLTGQVMAKIVNFASDLEDSLFELLLQTAPPQQLQMHEQAMELKGPVHDPKGRCDVVVNQAEVDELLASLGF